MLQNLVQYLLTDKVRNVLRPFRKLVPVAMRVWVKKDQVGLLISVEELKPQYEKSCKYLLETIGKDNFGDYFEFGVCHGTSLSCMNEVLHNQGLDNVRLFGFDSFEGMPAETNEEDGGWSHGQFRSEFDETRHVLTKQGIDWRKTYLTKGWFKDTLTEDFKVRHEIRKASLIMIDCDIYSAAKESLNFCKSLIVDHTIIIFDDWNTSNLADRDQGEKLAFTEFLTENPQFVAEEFGDYKYLDFPNGKLFIVTNQLA